MVPLYSGQQLPPLSRGLQLYGFYPFPIIVGQLERSCAGKKGRTGNLSVLQMRCSRNHRPDLCPIILTPTGATGSRLDA